MAYKKKRGEVERIGVDRLRRKARLRRREGRGRKKGREGMAVEEGKAW